MNVFEKSKKFVYQNARPIDLARWKYIFEKGSKYDVIDALKNYQNEDGGFGYGLEKDYLNPNSSPIQTWVATEILNEINFNDKNSSIIAGIIKYLSSGKDFNQKKMQWENTIPSNNDYPHAIWWSYDLNNGLEYKYNPTASLIGFYLKYANETDEFYNTAINIVKDAYKWWRSSIPYREQHVTKCFINLYNYLCEVKKEIINLNEFKEKLINQVKYEIDSDLNGWEMDYVCMPHDFIEDKTSFLYSTNLESINKECKFIIDHQLIDGSFRIPWEWYTEYKEFEISRNWWKVEFCIRYMKFLKEYIK